MSWSVTYVLGALSTLFLATGCDVRALIDGADDGADSGADSGANSNDDQGASVAERPPGSRMLSGTVTDACTGRGIAARVGTAGRRQCSFDGKGSYFFDELPEGRLALVAFKEGYKLFEVAVSITAEGTIQDIVLQPDTPGGCADPHPADVACECDLPGCT